MPGSASRVSVQASLIASSEHFNAPEPYLTPERRGMALAIHCHGATTALTLTVLATKAFCFASTHKHIEDKITRALMPMPDRPADFQIDRFRLGC
jgi:hypothetical protein